LVSTSPAFLSANLEKVPYGGWFTIAVSFVVAMIKFIWLTGQRAKNEALEQAQRQVNLIDVLSVSNDVGGGPPGDEDRRQQLASLSYQRNLTAESMPALSVSVAGIKSAFASAVSQQIHR
jgi:hypothetical protein